MQNLDLFGMQNAMNNQPVQMLHGVGFQGQTRGKATLFLMSRRDIPNQYRRPLNYNFGGEFRNALQDNLSRAQLPGYNSLSAMMLDESTARSAIMPSAIGSEVNLRTFSEFWTFILICDNDNGVSPLGTISSIPSRMLYSGWVADEPVARQNLSAGYVPNPMAVLQTTHHTTLTVQQQVTANGMHNHVETTGDYDYLTPTIQQLQNDGNTLYNLTPNKVAGAIIEDPNNYASFQLAASPIAASQTAVEVPTEINSPSYHLQRVVGSMAEVVKNLASPSQSNIALGNDVALNMLTTFLNTGKNVVLNDLNPEKPFTMGELQQRYGNGLEIVVCQQPSSIQYDLVSAAAPSRRNVLASIISSSMPALLAQFGLAEVGFRFNSFAPVEGGLGSVNGERGIFKLLNIATLYAGADAEMASAWGFLQSYLRRTLFSVIRANGGEFDLTLNCSLAGVSLINLQLLDEVQEGGLLETNNLLGGLNTPVVGGLNEFQANAGQLYAVVKDTMAVGTPMDSLFSATQGSISPIF